MIKTLLARFQQGFRTIPFPAKEPSLPARFLGRPEILSADGGAEYQQCRDICPTGAIHTEKGRLSLDIGKCLFCGHCREVCSPGTITFTREYRLAARQRRDLIVEGAVFPPAAALDKTMKRLFGRSLKLRQVSAGGCNGCELDINVLNTIVFDLNRFGIQFVASPRHADGILITGPVTQNMRLAVEKTYQAVPSPKLVIAAGACAISGGPYIDHPSVANGADRIVPVDLYIPGCPPHPLTILDGLLRLLGRIP